MVLPGDSEGLLGAIPLKDMDVLIQLLRQELIVNPDHPYFCTNETDVSQVRQATA
jgi:hypothetical protein